jgi:hypothetical protein
MKADGTGLKELARTRNRNASAVAWPAGDWVYYSEEGKAPRGCWGDDEKADTPEKRSIRRVNVVSGEDEEVGTAPDKIWQMSLALTSRKGSGRYAIVNYLADLSQPDKAVNSRNLLCGTMISPSGQYVTEVAETHADLRIWTWDLGTLMREFRVNAWAGAAGDGRNHCYRPRWSANSDNWVVMTHGMDFGATDRSTAALYNWKEQIQIQLTRNPLDGQACDEGESFWVAGLQVDFSVTALEGKAPYTIELESPNLDGEGWKWDFGDGATGTGTVGRHTYTQPGDYIAMARKGQSVLRQGVTVLPRKAPRVTGALLLDDTHVLVTLDEPVKIEEAPVSPKRAVPGLGWLVTECLEGGARGLQAAYYVGGDLGSALNLDAATPAKTGTVSVIDMAFAEARENFGLKFTGYVYVPRDGEYTFFTNSDDGSRLFIGEIEVVNNDGMHGAREVSGSIKLKAGKHPIRVYFMQGGGGSALSVSYEGPGIAKSQIPSHALFRDGEPVTFDGAAVKLASGRGATRLYLDPLGWQLVAEFDRPLAAKETLVLEGITDRAQVPNAVANPRLPVQRPSWPADTTGLVFLWENAKAANRIWDPVIGGVRETVMQARANHFDRDGALVCGQGLSDAGAEAPQQLIAGCKASEALSVEMVVRPESLEQSGKDGMLPLLAMSHGWRNGTFWLSQNKSRLQVTLARQSGDSQPQIFDLGALPSAGPHHIVVAMAPKRLALYVDGAKVREVDPSPAKFLPMAPPLKFGGEQENSDRWLWKGRMEGIAMYGRFVEEAEAARSWDAYRAKLAARKPMDRVVVDARLAAKTAAPEPKDMMPYRSALVVYEYAVQKVKDGKAIKDGQIVRVAHWGVRDLKNTPAAERALGTTFPLTLERFADHPELEGQFMRDDLPFSEVDLWTDDQP